MKSSIGLFLAIFFVFCSFTMVKSNGEFVSISDDLNSVIHDTLTTSHTIDLNLVEIEGELELIEDQTTASYYHDKFVGKTTASGEVFDNELYTAAHKTLPFGTRVKVTNVNNKRSVILTITDRGPYVKGRGIDLSKKAFFELTDNRNRGVLDVKIEKIVDEQS